MPEGWSKSEDAVSEFLEREREAMQAIEKLAISSSAESKTITDNNKSTKPIEEQKQIDWDLLEKSMIQSKKLLSFEQSKQDPEFEFLVKRYENGVPETDLWRSLLAKNEERIKAQREKNSLYMEELREKAAKYIADIEEAEKKDYEESNRQFIEYHYLSIILL